MTRVIVHAGFHKTGTTSLQLYLARHRRAFAPYFRYYGQNDFKHAGTRARIYAQRRFPWRLAAFRRALRRFLATVPDCETLVLSRENFSGAMPGHRDWRGRPLQDFRRAAVPLLTVVVAELTRRFGPDTEVELLYTTRDLESWLRSVYGHLLRSIHLTEDFEAFRAQFPAMPPLDSEAALIARDVGCKVTIRPVEDFAEEKPGPALAVLELAGVPEDIWRRFAPAERANSGESGAVQAEFLALNRSGKSRAELKRIKDRMREAAGG